MPIAKKNIPQDFLEQMKTNLTINTDEINEQKESNSSVISNSAETKPSNSPASVQQKESSKKGKYAAKVIFAGDKTYEASSKSLKITVK